MTKNVFWEVVLYVLAEMILNKFWNVKRTCKSSGLFLELVNKVNSLVLKGQMVLSVGFSKPFFFFFKYQALVSKKYLEFEK